MTLTRRLGAFGAATLGLGALFAGSPYGRQRGQLDINRTVGAIRDGEDHVTALVLARWIRDRKPGLRVIDVRSPAEFGAFAIPTAENPPMDRLVRTAFAPHETVVLYSEGGAHAGQAWVLLRALGVGNAVFIAGGLADWRDDVLSPVLPSDATPADVEAFHEAVGLSRYFGGMPATGGMGGSCRSASRDMTSLRRRGC